MMNYIKRVQFYLVEKKNHYYNEVIVSSGVSNMFRELYSLISW